MLSSSTRHVPTPSTATVVRLPISVTAGTKIAISQNARSCASRLSSFSSACSSSLRGSRRKACTARMPPKVSVKCTISAAIVSRVRR